MFSTTQAAEAPATTGPRYLSVGINDNVTFQGFETGTSSQKGTPYLEAVFFRGEDQDRSEVKDKFYMSEKAQGMSLRKVKHILVDGLGIDAAKVDAVQADTLEAYAAALNKLVPAKNSLRIKFTGEEYDSAGTVKTAKRISMPPFIEPMTVATTALKYDPTNAYDLKKMPVPDAATTNYSTESTSELPF